MQLRDAFEAILRDVRQGVRMARRTPMFSAVVVTTLALAIGGNTAVASLANAILLRPLPYPASDRLGLVVTNRRAGARGDTQDAQDGAGWRALQRGVKTMDVALLAPSPSDGVNFVADGAAVAVQQVRVSAGYFRVLGVAPAMGREFSPEEDARGGAPVAVLSHRLWAQSLHADPGIVGRTILLRGEQHTVVGVMPSAFEDAFSTSADVWTPARPSTSGEGGGLNYQVVGRVKPDHTWADANAELAALGRAHLQSQMRNGVTDAWWAMTPLQEYLAGDVRQPMQWLMGAMLIVLLMACANIAVLLLARGGARQREIGTRLALGSGRAAVVRQLLVESLLLGIAGGAFGMLVAALALDGLQAIGGPVFAGWSRATIDGRMLALTAAASIASSVLFGLLPAVQASGVDLVATLGREASRIVAGSSSAVRRSLIAGEVAMAVVLLTLTGLLVRTFINLQALDPGFEARGVTTATTSLQDARYATTADTNRLFDTALGDLERTPGVRSAAVSLRLPSERLLNEAATLSDAPGRQLMTNVMYVTPRFFETLNVPLRSGRAFTGSDTRTTVPVAIVNDMFVRASGETSLIGRRLVFEGETREIVGLVGNVLVANSGIDFPGRVPGPLEVAPILFIPAAQTSDGFLRLVHTWFQPSWTVRTAPGVNGAQALTAAISHVDPLLPVQAVRDLSSVERAATATERLLMGLIAGLAAAALLLALIGIHGLVSYDFAVRARELALRLALGAPAWRLVRGTARAGLVITGAGALAGVGIAWAALAVLDASSVLFRVDQHDPMTFLWAPGAFVAAGLVSSLWPARRVFRLDPASTLRGE